MTVWGSRTGKISSEHPINAHKAVNPAPAGIQRPLDVLNPLDPGSSQPRT